MTVHVLARAVARTGCSEALRAALLASQRDSLREPGCLRYEIAQNLTAPDEFTTIEQWRDEAAVAAHMQTPHVLRLLRAVPALVAAPPEIRTYRQLAPA